MSTSPFRLGMRGHQRLGDEAGIRFVIPITGMY